jgi:hypothetical protein
MPTGGQCLTLPVVLLYHFGYSLVLFFKGSCVGSLAPSVVGSLRGGTYWEVIRSLGVLASEGIYIVLVGSWLAVIRGLL